MTAMMNKDPKTRAIVQDLRATDGLPIHSLNAATINRPFQQL